MECGREIQEIMKHNYRDDIHFTTWIWNLSAALNDAGKFSTARNYMKACNSFSKFVAEHPSPPWPDEMTILKYNAWLQQRGIVRNTVSFYMRILRSAYNKAAEEGLVFHKKLFSKVYTGIDKTSKRAIDECLIARILSLDLKNDHVMELTRDMFIFSYCSRGMAFVDMVLLKKINIRESHIVYSRRKTGQRIYVKIEKYIRVIIDKYIRDDSEYIFPVLCEAAPEVIFRQYQTALGYYNRNLKRLGNIAGIDVRLSSYMARHSWASNARKHNIPINIISAGMGHDSEKTTRIYLSAIDSKAVDAANSKLLESLDRNSGPFDRLNLAQIWKNKNSF